MHDSFFACMVWLPTFLYQENGEFEMKQTITIDGKMEEPPKSILEESLADYYKALEHELDVHLQAKVIECLFILYLDEQEAENQNSRQPCE